MTGTQPGGDLTTVVTANEFFSTLWINESSGEGEFRRLDMDSVSMPVFIDTSLPTQLDIGDWTRKTLDIRSLAPSTDLFELTWINRVPTEVEPSVSKISPWLLLLLGENQCSNNNSGDGLECDN